MFHAAVYRECRAVGWCGAAGGGVVAEGLPAGAVPLAADVIAKIKAAPVDPERIGLVESPSLVVYRADANIANGCGIVICPGGAYGRLAWVKEAVEVAQYLNSKGITVGALKYRVPRRDPVEPHREPLQDAQRAVRWMRANASDLKLDVDRIGVLGFSAGGHLSVMTALHGDQATYPASDKIDEQSCKPNFLCPIYTLPISAKSTTIRRSRGEFDDQDHQDQCHPYLWQSLRMMLIAVFKQAARCSSS